ncbi:DNA polymerase III subunit delta [Venenivibrio stagnispumantis]|uniref:DNA-directed DNA polymerase n=1 Tax=Venenivibrio stagnispumantis TaxID=407998 RepID=A0AA45WMG5_9AQUI|nr:DNA polymerase III subunit delta [Venenivibrio stagnispumantis]MCW4573631.1 DNA polymerase III subunit delta [Venenivibrio stagnispumantis]SMP14260.1 DNA polymerase III, delta subunit [Venenivibrio stagnispumantis]
MEEKLAQKLIKEFDINSFKPVVLLYGQEEYLKRLIIDKFKEKEDSYLFWGDEVDDYQIYDKLSSSGLFSTGNTVILIDIDVFFSKLSKEKQNNFLHFLKNIKLPNRLILTSNKEKLTEKEPYKTIITIADIISSKPLTPSAFESSIKNKITREGKKIDDETLKYLVSKLDNDLYYAKHEIEKLILYCADKEEITKEDIDKIIVPKFQENVFVFLDKFFAKDKQAVLMYKNLLQTSHPFELQSLILNYLNKLLIYKTLQNIKPPEEIFKQLNITHPFQKSSIQKLSKNVSTQDLINAVKSLYKTEISQKVFYEDPEKQSILFVSKFILGKG